MGQELSHEPIDDTIPPRTLKSRTINAVAELIKDGKASRIVVLTGAGVSTSAGIPDFRSPQTGLYANLARLDLPYPEAVFDISYFRSNPTPFYTLARELYPGKFKPTFSHAFIALLARKGLLHMLFTQNIDCLERAAGVPHEKIIEAHGSFQTQHCIDCKSEFPGHLMQDAIESGDVPYCVVPQCNGLVKPDIVFFGEALPDAFRQNTPKIAQANLVIIMGTSLSVQPFASLPDYVLDGVPRILINLEKVGGLGRRADDVCVLSDCDEGVRDLAEALGWGDEVRALWRDVSGKEEARNIEEAPRDAKTKDQLLEEELEKLTREVDHALKISTGHKRYLEDHLGKKISHGAPADSDRSSRIVPNNRSHTDEIRDLEVLADTSVSRSKNQEKKLTDGKGPVEGHQITTSQFTPGRGDGGPLDYKSETAIQEVLENPDRRDLGNPHDE